MTMTKQNTLDKYLAEAEAAFALALELLALGMTEEAEAALAVCKRFQALAKSARKAVRS
jgi:hypothetical protein